MKRAADLLASASAISLLVAGCSGGSVEPRLVAGECAPMYGSEICTWAMVEDTSVVEIGATVPLAAIADAPSDAEMQWPPVSSAVVRLPQQATSGTGLNHLTVYWEAHGHPPAPYLFPHFDFHFYNISSEQREAIDCTNLAKPATLPAGYHLPDEEIPGIGMLVGICVPQMGMHALDQVEYTGTTPFSGTMVVGYYEGAPIFIEPMITQELLMRRESFTLAMPAVEAPTGVRYPRQVRADYDPVTESYRMAFSEFGPAR